jgi:serine/threonine protein kinase
VALKIVISAARAGGEERARFGTEAEAVARLHDPGIVPIYEVGEQAGCPYLALECGSGGSLYELLTGRPPLLGGSLLETLDQVRTHDPAPPQALQPKVCDDLATIGLKCLEEYPPERYPAAALARDLDLLLRGEAVAARKLTLWDQATRLVRHSHVDANWGAWAS